MLANAQTDMEANLLKLALGKKIALTKKNNDRAEKLAKSNKELSYFFSPPNIVGELMQDKNPLTLTAKVDRSVHLIAEIGGQASFLAKAKAVDVVNFFNNVYSIWEHLVFKNKCYRLESNTEFCAEAGAALAGGSPVEDICDLALDLVEATKKAVRDPTGKKPVNLMIGIEMGPVNTGMPGRVVHKFSTFGEGAVAASLLLLECPDNTIHLGPAIKGLLPGIYKVGNNKDIPGLGMTAKLEAKEGRAALNDKDIKSVEPIAAADPKEAAKGDDKPAAGSGDGGGGGGGGDSGGGGGGDGGGGAGGDDAAPAAEGEASSVDAAEVEGGASGSRPVSVVNRAQCCGSLKSGVCNLI